MYKYRNHITDLISTLPLWRASDEERVLFARVIALVLMFIRPAGAFLRQLYEVGLSGAAQREKGQGHETSAKRHDYRPLTDRISSCRVFVRHFGPYEQQLFECINLRPGKTSDNTLYLISSSLPPSTSFPASPDLHPPFLGELQYSGSPSPYQQ